ncbi:MAG: glycosyltransferase involved in cell wall biosynthesis [Bacteroidia bacterium]|jgi:glycosyltransferase involved in cell wall biosynthesis
MFVSGFTFVKNAVKLDYPVVEAITSVLPLVDELVVAVGKSDDETRELIASIDKSKIRIIDTVWDESLRAGGKVLAEETDKAKAAVNPDADWLIYIQADECIHEQYYDEIRSAMSTYASDSQVEGLLLDYIHFYGSYDFVGDSRTWYKKEIRVIKNDQHIESWKDAQGFRKAEQKLQVKKIDAAIYHYGWVRHPKYMMAKAYEANKLWHSDEWVANRFDPNKDFDYSQIDSLKHFKGSHPAVMQDRISRMNWSFTFDPSQKKFGLKTGFLYWVEKTTGWRIGEHRNYKVI